MVITIPIGQALMRGLKFYEFQRKLKEKGEDIFGIQPVKDVTETEKEERPDKKEAISNRKKDQADRKKDHKGQNRGKKNHDRKHGK